MEKREFVKLLNAIEQQITYDTAVAGILGTVYPNVNAEQLTYNNSHLIETIIEHLEYEMNDRMAFIRYFIYDMIFGKDKKMVLHNKKSIDLGSSDKLYDFLNDNMMINKIKK